MKSCPFCGSDDLITEPPMQTEADKWIVAVQCDDCDVCVSPAYASDSEEAATADAIDTWNRRAPVAAPAAAKPSTCCPGEHLVPMHSTDTKLCTGCKTEKHWPLEPGQKRTY